MDQQEQGGERPGVPGQEERAPGQADVGGRSAEATSGQGSAAALDLLRRRNFRGWRDQPDDRPQFE